MPVRTSAEATQASIARLRMPQAAYYNYRLAKIEGVIPVSGSAYHDGVLSATLASALAEWKTLVESDVTWLNDAHASISSADQAAARK